MSKDYAEAALKKLPECKGGEASEFEGKKHGKKMTGQIALKALQATFETIPPSLN